MTPEEKEAFDALNGGIDLIKEKLSVLTNNILAQGKELTEIEKKTANIDVHLEQQRDFNHNKSVPFYTTQTVYMIETREIAMTAMDKCKELEIASGMIISTLNEMRQEIHTALGSLGARVKTTKELMEAQNKRESLLKTIKDQHEQTREQRLSALRIEEIQAPDDQRGER